VEVEVEFKRGPYNGTRSLDTKRFRVVGVRNEDADDYHLYVTNLSREEFFPADLAQIYRCRWEVELLFRELKTQYDLDEFDTSNEDVVKILLYAALLSLLVSRELLELVTEQAGDEIVFPPELGGDLPVARPAHPPRTRRVSRLLATAAVGAADRRRTEDSPATTDITRDARYRYATEV